MIDATGGKELLPVTKGSQLALSRVRIEERTLSVGHERDDTLLYVISGEGRVMLGDDARHVSPGVAALALAGEAATIEAPNFVEILIATAGPDADRHAPLGERELVVLPDDPAESATGTRSFRILLGPHNGSTRATLFVGFVPPGRAPWHYHLYDEVVWIPEGPGRLHRADRVEELEAGAAFRLRPREVHIVENAHPRDEMTLIGVFTPAGSPSAAYLMPDIATDYRFSA